MKKTIGIFLFASAFTVLISSCGAGSDKSTTTEEETSTEMVDPAVDSTEVVMEETTTDSTATEAAVTN